MAERKTTRPAKRRSIRVFLVVIALVTLGNLIFDNVLLFLASILCALFAIGYFIWYYTRTGRNVIEDSVRAKREEP